MWWQKSVLKFNCVCNFLHSIENDLTFTSWISGNHQLGLSIANYTKLLVPIYLHTWEKTGFLPSNAWKLHIFTIASWQIFDMPGGPLHARRAFACQAHIWSPGGRSHARRAFNPQSPNGDSRKLPKLLKGYYTLLTVFGSRPWELYICKCKYCHGFI